MADTSYEVSRSVAGMERKRRRDANSPSNVRGDPTLVTSASLLTTGDHNSHKNRRQGMC